MKIYTKTGDLGETSLLSGKRVSKADERLDAYGTIDELNALIGLVADQPVNEGRLLLLRYVQDRLFVIGSHLAAEDGRAPGLPDLAEGDIEQLEVAIDDMNETLPPLRHFVLPGGHPAVSYAHVARTVCRRAERRVIGISDQVPVSAVVIKYLNRLSDYLFVLSRQMAHELHVPEIRWEPKKES